MSSKQNLKSFKRNLKRQNPFTVIFMTVPALFLNKLIYELGFNGDFKSPASHGWPDFLAAVGSFCFAYVLIYVFFYASVCSALDVEGEWKGEQETD
jgi:hypothetical protein